LRCKTDSAFSRYNIVSQNEEAKPGVAELADALDSKANSGVLKTEDLQENKAT